MSLPTNQVTNQVTNRITISDATFVSMMRMLAQAIDRQTLVLAAAAYDAADETQLGVTSAVPGSVHARRLFDSVMTEQLRAATGRKDDRAVRTPPTVPGEVTP